MIVLGYLYRISSNFLFLGLAYFSLNFLENYQHRFVVAALLLTYAAMRSASAFSAFHFFQCIERLEVETRRLAKIAGEGPATANVRRQIFINVGNLRRVGEKKSYIDLLFLSLVMVLCVSKIVTE